MNKTNSDLRKLVRETLSVSYDPPVEGFTKLMQEFDVPHQHRKKISQTIKSVFKKNGGPLDAAYEVENLLKIDSLPMDFYTQAVDCVRKDTSDPLSEGIFGNILGFIGGILKDAFSVEADTSKIRKPGKKLEPKKNLEDQIFALSVALQTTGAAIELLDQDLDSTMIAIDKLADNTDNEDFKSEAEQALRSAAEAYGYFRSYLVDGDLEKWSPPIAKVGKGLPDAPDDISKAYEALTSALAKIDGFNVPGEASKILKQDGAQEAAKKTDSISFIEDSMNGVKKISSVSEKAKKVEASIADLIKLMSSKDDQKAPVSSDIVGEKAVLRKYVNSLLKEIERQNE